MIEAISSDSFRQSLYWLGISCLLLAVGVVIVGFAYYGRTRDVYGSTSEKQRWTLLMGTWRDSLLITLLFVAQTLLYRAEQFVSAADVHFIGPVFLAQALTPIADVILLVLMFVVTIQRIILISRWLTSQRLSENRSDPERETP